MYLVDTNVLSEMRRLRHREEDIRAFFHRAGFDKDDIHVSVVTVAELRQGVHHLRHKGDPSQAEIIGAWVEEVMQDFADKILIVDKEIAELWARLRVPQREPTLDKLIAATALVHGMTVMTRNIKDFKPTGVKMLNPFD
jgi:toxin FitB